MIFWKMIVLMFQKPRRLNNLTDGNTLACWEITKLKNNFPNKRLKNQLSSSVRKRAKYLPSNIKDLEKPVRNDAPSKSIVLNV